jgi:hypothetical protein
MLNRIKKNEEKILVRIVFISTYLGSEFKEIEK